MSKEELRELEHFLCRRAEFEAELECSQKARRRSKNTILVDILNQEISHNTRIVEIIGTIITHLSEEYQQWMEKELR